MDNFLRPDCHTRKMPKMHFDPETATTATASACQSCDTFVCLPPATASDTIIFGKNSDRPSGEVQQIVQIPARKHEPGTKLQCTYIDIDQVRICSIKNRREKTFKD